MKENILQEIYQHKLQEVRSKKKETHLQEICKNIKCLEKPKDFFYALQEKKKQNKTALICEIKKASPSKGIIRENFNHIEIAKSYENAGATCLSILTDEKYFLGKNQYLKDVRQITNLPILRKDFMVDPYQIYESRMIGADCILLIVAMLDDKKLQELEDVAISLNLSVLLEIHNEEELQRAMKLKSKLIGINNRNLKNMKVDINNSALISKTIPKDYFIVAESGIKSRDDINFLLNCGINSFLIGEYFMLQDDIKNAVCNFL